jgi:hypothetical protein
MLIRLKRDISVNIVTTPIPIRAPDASAGGGRLHAVVRQPLAREGAKGATWLVDAFLAEHRRQRQGRASNAAQFYAEAERIRTRPASNRSSRNSSANAGQLPELTEVNMSMMDRADPARR